MNVQNSEFDIKKLVSIIKESKLEFEFKVSEKIDRHVYVNTHTDTPIANGVIIENIVDDLYTALIENPVNKEGKVDACMVYLAKDLFYDDEFRHLAKYVILGWLETKTRMMETISEQQVKPSRSLVGLIYYISNTILKIDDNHDITSCETFNDMMLIAAYDLSEELNIVAYTPPSVNIWKDLDMVLISEELNKNEKSYFIHNILKVALIMFAYEPWNTISVNDSVFKLFKNMYDVISELYIITHGITTDNVIRSATPRNKELIATSSRYERWGAVSNYTLQIETKNVQNKYFNQIRLKLNSAKNNLAGIDPLRLLTGIYDGMVLGM